MADKLVVERNVLVPMRDGVLLAADLVRPATECRVPAIINFGPYHKDGRGGLLGVDTVHRHFANLGYATLTADLRGLGNSGGHSPGPFAPGEAFDGHDLVEWAAQQTWCDGNVGMWGVSYPGVTALATAATRPPHLKAIVPIHATSDLYRGVVSLGGTASGFWMRADWGPRMAAYNLMPPLLHDGQRRWQDVWADHLAGNTPWLEAFTAHPGFDDYWRSRVADMAQIECPTFNICGWRDLYADCTPRDYQQINAPKKLMMGAWKHEFPDTGKEAPAAGMREMERWFERWLKGVLNGIDDEAPLSLFVQGREGRWRSEQDWPPRRQTALEFFMRSDGALAEQLGNTSTISHCSYDPTVGIHSLVWDPWTTSLDPTHLRDHSADDARSLCFTGPVLTEPLELIGTAYASIDLTASVLPLNLVVKLSAVDANGRSTLITTGWADLGSQTSAGQRSLIHVELRATAYQLQAGQRLRVALSCADFPRIWPTPLAASLQVFHGHSRIRLPVCPVPGGAAQSPVWGELQPDLLRSDNDLGGSQGWEISRDLMGDGVRLSAAKTERVRVDAHTELAIDHAYSAVVSGARPDLAHMRSTTTVRVVRPSEVTQLVSSTVSTSGQTTVDVDIQINGQPHWQRQWQFSGAAKPPGP